MKNNLLDAFNIKETKNKYSKNDYDSFKDKDLLDKFRLDILNDLSKKGFASSNISKDLINTEIDDITYGYSLTNEERLYLYNLIDGEINGYGPITELLKDNNISEIMVNSPKDIYIEVDGLLKKDESISFINNDHILRVVEKLIEDSGKTLDISNPMIDASLPDGSRINAIIPPLSKNPIITIRKFKKNIETIEDLIRNGSLTIDMANFLNYAVSAHLNIIISGSSDTGKTTLLNILGNFISDDERIITIEDVRELNLVGKHVVSLETRDSSSYNEVNTRKLVKNALRMRPDRIIIGEIRGGEAYDLIQAMNTGHEGSITTLHANGPEDALNRLESMVFLDGMEIGIEPLRNYISNAVDLVIHIGRMRDGKKRITAISEITGMEDGKIKLSDIFTFTNQELDEHGYIKGEYKITNKKPKCLHKITESGYKEVSEIFKK